MENQAILLVKNHQDKIFTYLGKDPDWYNISGHIQLLEDMNCCAPTHSVLFAFVTKTKRKVMTAKDFMTFLSDCQMQ